MLAAVQMHIFRLLRTVVLIRRYSALKLLFA